MEPLNLPRGSVRSIIVLGCILADVVLGLWGTIEAFTAMMTLTGVVTRDYFGTRIYQNTQDGPPLPPPSS